ncbi:hypothetical protein [Streptomyces sp. NPDC060194]|uniref:hypothetical protein n=1 Tax=Streptomyces sp. NPDC060194 TaxID=3347069 RepID=UPI00365F3443
MAPEKRPSAEFDMKIVPRLPGGRAVLPAEEDGRFVWLIAAGQMSEQCAREMTEYLNHIVASGKWVQNWPGTASP